MTNDPFILRANAAQATLDQWKARPMRLGTSDCVRMTASHLRRLGHKVKLPASGSYRSVRSALKALDERGYSSLADALDAMGLERIAPASAIVGDVLMLPAEDKLGALVVALGNGRVVGYHEEAIGAAVLQPVKYVTAWRAI
ncbi:MULTISPECIES: DUF6950 family protein [Sphingomonas]|jgi:Domain of unknown function (DUF6950)|uniref:DUF6950 domain-containing protein n=1 Tax=Sphingomonas zeae TaxID=1646122 RepID=A0A7Y6EG30_9SPHN|nr:MULTISPECIES: hypothetical protein [Sphingomonas]MBB4049628.1 hypothetical protein [Sphingomonas zeae]MDK8187999.1 hypothetical protein [Sphingomonas zeae]MDK8217933.1 hypothetical protein [Sphingomonas sp. UMB7805-LC452B]NUU46010.1 hypothetical protein [Sphingomonas zeae]